LTLSKREVKSIELVTNHCVIPVNQKMFIVRSQSNAKKSYEVTWQKKKWCCTCEDFAKRRKPCKHVHAVNYYMAIQNLAFEVKSHQKPYCPKCGSGDFVIKRGVRYNRSGPVQRYFCKACKMRFVSDTAFAGMRSKAATIVSALDLYFRGLSLRQVAEHIEFTHGISVTHSTVHNWIEKYVKLVDDYVNMLRINASSRWHMDDTLVRVSGRHMVLWGLLDSETRYLLALHISSKRGAEDAQVLIRDGLKRAKNKPAELVSDGLNSYSLAVEREFKSNPQAYNIIHVQGPLTASFNNKMERFHGTLKSRVKNMGALNNEETAKIFSKGFKIYYNFIKPHKALNKRSPAQAAGIALKKSSWLELIRSAGRRNQ